MSIARITAVLAVVSTCAILAAAQSGSGKTTRYWDCCKPSCAWNNVGGIDSPVKVCDKSDNPLAGGDSAQSGCTGGTAYMCSDQSPWAVNKNLAYGFAAVSSANTNCCTCYQLTFTSGAISGKKMVVQATNTGSDVGSTQFDLAMPGGGFGQFDGCTKEWGATSAVWGAQYGGPTTNTCSQFPTALQPGCSFRWGWFQGTENPTVDYEVATCPAEIVAKSGCSRSGGAVPSNSPSTPVATSAALASSAPAPGSNGTPHESSSAPSSAISPPSSQSTSSTLASVVSSLATGAATEDASPSDLPTAIKSDSMHSGHSTPAYPIGTGLPISHSPHHPHVPHSQTLPPYVHKQGEGQDDDNTCEP